MSLTGRTSRKAVLSVVLGLFSPVGLALTGVPAILVGFVGLREINASDGQLRGRRLAVAGMVLGCVGILLCGGAVGMSLVRDAWAKAERLACEKNLIHIGQALDDYAGKDNPYPTGTRPNAKLPPEARLSWCATVLSGLGEPALYEQIHKDVAWDAPGNHAVVSRPVRWFICPAHPGELPEDAGPTYYVGLAGAGKDAARLPAADPRAGLFGYDRQARRDDITRGLSQTAIVAETAAEVGPWAAGGLPSVRGLDTAPGHLAFLGPGGQFGGLHRGGTNVLFADGHVNFVNDSVDPEVVTQVVRIHADVPAGKR
jgi:prepilin-type processing-associated H-X9-DG protein